MDGGNNSDYQGGTSNTNDSRDNAFRNIDLLPLGKLLHTKQDGRIRKMRKLRKKGMPNASDKRTK